MYKGRAFWIERIVCQEHAEYEALVRDAWADVSRLNAELHEAHPEECQLIGGPVAAARAAQLTARQFSKDSATLRALATSSILPAEPREALDILREEIDFNRSHASRARQIADQEPISPGRPPIERGLFTRQVEAEKAKRYDRLVSDLMALEMRLAAASR
jgi:hypothetical protein